MTFVRYRDRPGELDQTAAGVMAPMMASGVVRQAYQRAGSRPSLDYPAGHGPTVRNRVTFSIVALDRESGEIGVAVQTCWPCVGAAVPWVVPGIGAVATQSFTNVDLGPRALARLRAGLPAADVLAEVLAGDQGRDRRQVGIVDVVGRSAAHTGRSCVAEAGHVTAPDVSVQANMLERSGVWLAMLEAYRTATGDLADRLMAALRVGDRDGGDIRGRQSAALLVAPAATRAPGEAKAAEATSTPGAPSTFGAEPWDRRFDLRVDHSGQPLDDLARLLRVARAYESFDAAMRAIEADEMVVALEQAAEAHRQAPADAQLGFWHGVLLLASGRPDEGRPVVEAALRREPRLTELGHRFVRAGHGAALAEVLRHVREANQAPRA